MNRIHRTRTASLLALAGIGLIPAVVFGQTTKGVTQLSQLTLSQSGNAGIWGWVGSDGTEYALPTTRSGTAIVSLKDPKAPKELFHLASPAGIWQELLTVGKYMYKCAEQGTGGMQIFDLSPLPAKPIELASWTGVATCHSLWSDSLATPPRVYVEGSGDTKILSLADPAKPALVGTIKNAVHDGFARANTVFISNGGSKGVDIWNAASPAEPVRLGRIDLSVASTQLGEGTAGYSHNIWLTNDNKYAFTTEETNGKTLKVWDISDLAKPKFTGGKYLSGTGMAHNVYIRNNALYLSHYGQGVRILDFSDPANLKEVGFHNPGGSSWGCFPWLPSGLIIHGNGGLRVFDPDPAIKALGAGGSSSLAWGRPISEFNIAGLEGNQVRFHLPKSGAYELSILDISGKSLFNAKSKGDRGLQNLDLGARQLATGSYFVKLRQEAVQFSVPARVID